LERSSNIRYKPIAQETHTGAFIGEPVRVARNLEVALDAVSRGKPRTLEGNPIHLNMMKDDVSTARRALYYTPKPWV
jgi:hypothetical protein